MMEVEMLRIVVFFLQFIFFYLCFFMNFGGLGLVINLIGSYYKMKGLLMYCFLFIFLIENGSFLILKMVVILNQGGEFLKMFVIVVRLDIEDFVGKEVYVEVGYIFDCFMFSFILGRVLWYKLMYFV